MQHHAAAVEDPSSINSKSEPLQLLYGSAAIETVRFREINFIFLNQTISTEP